jgi:hypothetical protein
LTELRDRFVEDKKKCVIDIRTVKQFVRQSERWDTTKAVDMLCQKLAVTDPSTATVVRGHAEHRLYGSEEIQDVKKLLQDLVQTYNESNPNTLQPLNIETGGFRVNVWAVAPEDASPIAQLFWQSVNAAGLNESQVRGTKDAEGRVVLDSGPYVDENNIVFWSGLAELGVKLHFELSLF